MKFTDLDVRIVVFAIDIQADQEVLPLLKIQGDGEFVTRGGVELRVLKFVGLESPFTSIAPVGQAMGEVVDQA